MNKTVAYLALLSRSRGQSFYLALFLSATLISGLLTGSSAQAQISGSAIDVGRFCSRELAAAVDAALTLRFMNQFLNEGLDPDDPNAYEVGVYIFERRDGTYGWTRPTATQVERGGPHWDLQKREFRDGFWQLSSGERIIGTIHTHPNRTGHSREDVLLGDMQGWNTYVVTADGRLMLHRPNDRTQDGLPRSTEHSLDSINRAQLELECLGAISLSPPVTPIAHEDRDRCEKCSASHGDPHITTSDGFHYDFQAAGEFIALESITDDLVIQVRQEPWENSKTVSLNTAAAANVHGDRVAVYGARPEGVQIKVNGRDYSADDSWRKLPKGGTVRNHRGKVVTRWLDGTEMWVESFSKHLNVYVKLAPERSGQVRGLLGNYNDNPDDELITRDGKQIKLSGKKDELYWVQLYETFGESWRINEAESLFDYVQGKNHAAFQIKSFPIKSFTIIDLSDDDRKQAQAVCTSNGIRTQPLLDDCILDVGVTKDAEFARSALAVSTRRYPENTGRSLETETKSFTVNIDKPGTYPIENFDAQAGQRMFFRALASGGLKWSKWELQDPEGKIVFTKDFYPGSMQPGEHVLPKTGNYRSTLTTSGSETGTLEVTRNLVPDPQIFDINLPIRISPDVPAKGAGRIELPGSKDTFRFTANSGDTLALSVLKKDDRLYLGAWQLRDPKGKLIYDDLLHYPLERDPEARQAKVSIKENGVHTLTVTGGSTGTSPRFDYGYGEYGIFLRFVPR